jgi:hypothetical protein
MRIISEGGHSGNLRFNIMFHWSQGSNGIRIRTMFSISEGSDSGNLKSNINEDIDVMAFALVQIKGQYARVAF